MAFKKSAKLIVYASAIYAIAVYLYRGLLPANFPSAITLLVLPVCILVVILYSDLLSRANLSTETMPNTSSGRSLNREVELLSRQVGVASRSSPDYYETVLLSRLRDSLVEKMSIETGLDKALVKQKLYRRSVGPRLLHDPELYEILFTQHRVPSKDRERTLEMIVDRIGQWKA